MLEGRGSALSLTPAAVVRTPLPGGGMHLRSPLELGAHPERLTDHLLRWAEERPDHTFLAERTPDGSWRRSTYRESLSRVRSVAQGLLERGGSGKRPVMILSENSVDNALLQLACLHVGIPVAPVSPAYSLVSQDHAKLKYLFELVRPGLVYAASGAAFARAFAALDLKGTEVVVSSESPDKLAATLFASLAATSSGPAVDAASRRVEPDSVAKLLFTSGSTGMPKAVVNTHRMLCSNQQAMAQLWRFLEEKPPVVLDWLPWNHTFGGNHNFNLVLRNGGSLYIDAGKPVPGAIEKTVENLREVSPTIYFNVPRGYDALLPYLESDAQLRDSFFRRLDLLFYSGAMLSQPTWARLEKLSLAARGELVPLATGLGATETSPGITLVHYPISRAGVVGLPMPGIDVKLAPKGGKLELRVRGPNVTPGYYERPDLTANAFDEEGYYCMGDACKLLDPEDPAKGIVFDGRVSEEFKLNSGTWVNAGIVRIGAMEAASPLLQDAVVTGHDREYIGLLAWPNVAECQKLAPGCCDSAQELCSAPEVLKRVGELLRARNADLKGSSTRIGRILLMAEPPNLDADEITDKGYINQRAALERRAALVERLYAEPPPEDVVVL